MPLNKRNETVAGLTTKSGPKLKPVPVRGQKFVRSKPELPPVSPGITKLQDAWYNNPVIMERVERVTNLELQGYSYRQISVLLGVSLGTIQQDVDRMRALRGSAPADEESRRINRQRSVEVFRAVQREAWRRLNPQPLLELEEDLKAADKVGGDSLPERGRKFLPTAREAAELLNQIVASEREVMRLQGTTVQEAQKDGFDTNSTLTIVEQLTRRFTARISGPTGEGGAEGTGEAAVDPHPGAIEGDTVPLALLGAGESATSETS